MKEPTLPPPDYRGPHTGEPFWNLMSMKAALRQATPPAQVPAGYKLVPIEPTDEMIKLGIEAYKTTKRTIYGTGGNQYKLTPEQRMRNAYRAMIEAEPEVKP